MPCTPGHCRIAFKPGCRRAIGCGVAVDGQQQLRALSAGYGCTLGRRGGCIKAFPGLQRNVNSGPALTTEAAQQPLLL